MSSGTESVFEQLSALVSGPIPDEYVEFLNHYPSELQDFPRGAESDGSQGHVSQVELPGDIGIVHELNVEARRCAILDPDGVEFLWPNSLLIIGETGTGDYYCLDTSGELSGVLQYEHQPVEFYEIADSLSEFSELLLESLSSDDA